MRRRLPLCLILIASLLATANPSQVVQAFAWTRMFAGYARTLPLAAAARATFDPGNRCCLCRAVQAAEKKPDTPAPLGGKLEARILLIAQSPGRIMLGAPAAPRWPAGDRAGLSAERAAPPTRPPLA